MLLFKGLPEKENMEKQTKAENGQRSWNWQPIVAKNPKWQIPLKLVYIFPNYVTSPLNYTVLQSTLLAVIQILCPIIITKPPAGWEERSGDTLTPAPPRHHLASTWNVTVWTRSNNHVSPISQACNYSLHYYSLFQLHCLIKHNLWSGSFHTSQWPVKIFG